MEMSRNVEIVSPACSVLRKSQSSSRRDGFGFLHKQTEEEEKSARSSQSETVLGAGP